MKHIYFTALNLMLLLSLSGCGNSKKRDPQDSPAFMAGCYREEVVSSDYHIPDMTTPRISGYIQNILKTLPGYVDCACDMTTQTLKVSYQSSVLRKMNIEETIAYSGFAVNDRPANPNAQIPEGVK
ncbi:MAG: hypothetical protein JXR25_15075 [Pontiellaceae bacterium]|nr:hypothetical protein [Pontiellaceae bacterium]MBN2786142.1 hypothetical protein [Pontiellaceae bacterium]